ncbi:MAG TPA: DUF2917 domain-containing protein [Pseudomonadales bacterium]|nr:DUF2917 domain-containing protein [Pseudomonadales bacterium]
MNTNLAPFFAAARRLLKLAHAVAGHSQTDRPSVIRLPREQVIRLEKNSGIKSVKAVGGMVWLTGTPASGDVLLVPGEYFELGEHWPYVIQALEPSEFLLKRISKR